MKLFKDKDDRNLFWGMIIGLTLYIIFYFFILPLTAKGQNRDLVLLELFTTENCERCPLALEKANSLDQIAIINWYLPDETKLSKIRRVDADFVNYPAMSFDSRYNVGWPFNDSIIQISKDSALFHTKQVHLSMNQSGMVRILINGNGGVFWFVSKKDPLTHKPARVIRLRYSAGLHTFMYPPKSDEYEFICWMSEYGLIDGVAKLTRNKAVETMIKK
jgi:hypothetical protein